MPIIVKQNVPDFSLLFIYDESSPTFLRRAVNVPMGRHKDVFKFLAGSVAGRKNKDGYIHVSVGNKVYKGHRIVWQLLRGNIPEGLEVDHIDGDCANNCVTNLRLVTHKTNTRNGKMRNTNTSGHTGVSWHKRVQKWYANWMDVDGTRKTRACNSKEEAIKLRSQMIEELNLLEAGYTERHGT